MIEKAELIRLEKGSEGTFGVLKLDGKVFCVTLEPPDLGNASDISCIPEGTYRCKSVKSPHFGRTYEITDVPDRTNILIHPGNLPRDTHGCLLLGQKFGALGDVRGVLTSRLAVDDFLLRAGGTEFDLNIVDAMALPDIG